MVVGLYVGHRFMQTECRSSMTLYPKLSKASEARQLKQLFSRALLMIELRPLG